MTVYRNVKDTMEPKQHLPLSVPVYQILLSLVSEDFHGYAIIQDIAARTSGEVSLTASTLYAAIRRLREADLIEELTSRPSGDPDPRRRYYRITDDGRAVVQAEAERLERQVLMARDKRLLPSTRTRTG